MRRPAIRRRIRPMRQGSLDGLCGVYAIVNVMRYLAPEIDADRATELFAAMMRARHEQALRRPLAFVYRGLGRRSLIALTGAAIDHVARTAGIEIEAEWLAPAKLKRSSLPTIWRSLSANIGPSCAVIVGLGGRTSHWTCVVDITSRQMRLFDSDGMCVLRRDQCTPRPDGRHYDIESHYVLFVRRRPRRRATSSLIELLV